MTRLIIGYNKSPESPLKPIDEGILIRFHKLFSAIYVYGIVDKGGLGLNLDSYCPVIFHDVGTRWISGLRILMSQQLRGALDLKMLG